MISLHAACDALAACLGQNTPFTGLMPGAKAARAQQKSATTKHARPAVLCKGRKEFYSAAMPPEKVSPARRAILPVAADFAQTGVLASTVLCLVVAWANVYTTDLLLWQAYATGCLEYELVALSVGGRWWKVSNGQLFCPLAP